MPDHDLTRLGSRAFEQMVVVLARRVLGPGVQAFGDGPDSGREATFEGTIRWSATSPEIASTAEVWTGFTVLQAMSSGAKRGSRISYEFSTLTTPPNCGTSQVG